jgi:hypothetical protein
MLGLALRILKRKSSVILTSEKRDKPEAFLLEDVVD